MSYKNINRRNFLHTTAIGATSVILATSTAPFTTKVSAQSPSDRLRFGAIGVGGRGASVANSARRLSDIVAVCDLDTQRIDRVNKSLAKGKATGYQDYRKILDRNDIDFVTIGTTDHWHTRIAIHAMQAGKDVYCEKPLTLTIEEGKQICKVTKETGRVFQVGTQQRSEMGQRFLTALGIIREGRIGKIKKITCNIGTAPVGGPFKKSTPPANLDWNMWLGQAPLVDYIKERCHYQFRWWYEYSGGKMTDWGAHHVDIAQWALEQNGVGQGALSIEPIVGDLPIPFVNGVPTKDNFYNTTHNFHIKCLFPDEVEMHIVSKSKEGNGILFEGTKGSFFVTRSKLLGKPIEELIENPLLPETILSIYKGKKITNHMENFFACMKDRSDPISDVYTHHTAMTTCHLANISIRLGRKINWNPKTEQVVGDDEANQWQTREQRKGFESKG
jgi:predicted dehydrogenase